LGPERRPRARLPLPHDHAADQRHGSRRVDNEDAAVEDFAAAQELALDDFFTFAARRTDAFDDADDFRAIRFHVTAELAGRVFDQFVVDVGFADSISWTPDAIETSDLLSFAGIERIRVPALPLPHHIAEKLHAYTRKYGASGRESTRPKDLVDMLLISRLERLDASALRNAMEVTFGQRGQQPVPANVPPPPSSWRAPYGRLATEVDVEPDLDKAFARPPPSFSIRSSPAAPTAHGTLSISAGPKR
jgi:hypothetical protein